MGRTISQDKIVEINEVYLLTKTYSKTAEIVGVSPSTVKKYVIAGYTSNRNTQESTKSVIDKKLPPPKIFSNFEEIAALSVLLEEEREQIQELWKELLL